MATTAQLRLWYADTIVSLNPLACDFSRLRPVRFLAGGAVADRLNRNWIDLRVHPAGQVAFGALAATFHRHGYSFDELAGGTANCRLITGGSGTSPHAHAVASDTNPSRNGYTSTDGTLDDPSTTEVEGLLKWGRYTDMSPQMVREAENILTGDGRRALAWGGRWWSIKDPMHWELDTSPDHLATGIRLATVPGWDGYQAWLQGEPPMTPEGYLPLLLNDGTDAQRPHKRSDVAWLQTRLNRAFGTALRTDGIYGPATAAAVALHLPDPTADGEGTPGRAFTGNRADDLDWAFAVRAASSIGSGVGVSLATVRAEIATHASLEASPEIHPHRHAEGTTGQPRP